MDDGGDTDYEEDEQLDGGEHDNDTNSTNATKEVTNGEWQQRVEIVKKSFLIDYCKRGTTKCKRCKKQIPLGELRIGKSVMFKT